MDYLEPVYLSSKDLSCPVCLSKYDLEDCQPMALICGHNICSTCLHQVYYCPICRSNIPNKSSHSKNVLISSLITPKTRMKECQKHQRPFEFFCRDHEALVCAECGFDDNHFSHDIIKVKDVNKKIEDTQQLVQEITKNESESKRQFEQSLDVKKKTLKRSIDEIFDKFLSPILLLKKKLHREADSLIYIQKDNYDKNLKEEELEQWKEENEMFIEQWGKDPNGEIATKLLKNKLKKMQRKATKYKETGQEKEKVAEGKVDEWFEEMKTTVDFMNAPWASLEKKLKKVAKQVGNTIHPQVELGAFVEHLREYGADVIVRQENEESIIEINQLCLSLKEPSNPQFYCTMNKANLKCDGLLTNYFESVCTSVERIMELSDFQISMSNMKDEPILVLGKSIAKVSSLERFSARISSRGVSDRIVGHFWSHLAPLKKLKYVEIQLDSRDALPPMYSEPIEVVSTEMPDIEEVKLIFLNCAEISSEGLNPILETILGKSSIKIFSFTLRDCEYLETEAFKIFCEVLGSLVNLENLTLALEGFYELGDERSMTALASSIGGLIKLNKLHLSFAGGLNIPTHYLVIVLEKILSQTKQLNELTLDLSSCLVRSLQFFEKLGKWLSKISTLKKLTLILKRASVGIYAFDLFANELSKLHHLKSLKIDYSGSDVDQAFHLLAQQALDKIPGLVEKSFVFSELPTENPIRVRRSSTLLSSYSDESNSHSEDTAPQEQPLFGLNFHRQHQQPRLPGFTLSRRFPFRPSNPFPFN